MTQLKMASNSERKNNDRARVDLSSSCNQKSIKQFKTLSDNFLYNKQKAGFRGVSVRIRVVIEFPW